MYKKFGCLAASPPGIEFRDAVRSRSIVSFYVLYCLSPGLVEAWEMVVIPHTLKIWPSGENRCCMLVKHGHK